MSETIDLQPIIAKLSDSEEKKQEQTLRKELLELQTSLKSEEVAEQDQAIVGIKAKLEAFELTLSADDPRPELQASIDKAQAEIKLIDDARAAEEKKVLDETGAESKGLFASIGEIFNSQDPTKSLKDKAMGWKNRLLGLIGIGGAATVALTKASGDKTGEAAKNTTSRIDSRKKSISDFFDNLIGGDETAPTTETETETVDLGSEKHKALVEEVKKLNIDFKDPTPSAPEVNETKDRLALLSTKTVTMIKSVGEEYTGVRVTSTLRSREENKGLLPASAEDSKHMYGFAFDIGRDLRTPPKYTLLDIETYIKANYPSSKTLIHRTGDDEHLHIETDESTDGKTVFETDEDIKTKLTPPVIA